MTDLVLAYATPRTAFDAIHEYCLRVSETVHAESGARARVVLRQGSGRWAEGSGHEGALRSTIGASPAIVAVQYNPFSYSRGVAPGLVAELAALRRRGVTIILTVHEPYVTTGALRLRIIGVGQRLQLRALTALADRVLVTTDRWRRFLPHVAGQQAELAVVGSTLPDRRGTRGIGRGALGLDPEAIVCATLGLTSPHHHLGHVRSALTEIRDAGREVVHLNLGRAPDADVAHVTSVRSVSPGPLPAAELATMLASADVFLASYADGATTRRTGLIAALQHGLATVVTTPPDPSAPWMAGGIRLATSAPQFASEARFLATDAGWRARCAQDARVAFERHFDGPAVVAPYLRALVGGDRWSASPDQ